MITLHFIRPGSGTPPVVTEAQVKPGQSLMSAAMAADVDGIAADCGGALSCATCHVLIGEEWIDRLPPPGDDELAMLEFTAVARTRRSRLSCQVELTDALDGLTVELPPTQY